VVPCRCAAGAHFRSRAGVLRLGTVSLIIEDDGAGFDAEEATGTGQRGFGLLGMRERATLVDGTLEIESHPGEGTTIVVRIPAAAVPNEPAQTEECAQPRPLASESAT
jgi:signal transduction histidine kinase